MKKYYYLLALSLIVAIPNVHAASLVGRLGLGTSGHLVSGQQVLSTKLQRNRSTAIGGIFGLNSSSAGTSYALGAKVYRYIYEEPQLNFYSAISGNIFTYVNSDEEIEQGYQVDTTLGSEFSFQGLESLGFSFEFGLSYNKYLGESSLQTIGVNFIQSAIHFYL